MCIPNLLIWGAFFWGFARKSPVSDDWVSLLFFFAIFFALPLPLIIPIYKRYLTGARPGFQPQSAGGRFLLAAIFAAASCAYAVDALTHPGDRWNLVFHLAGAACWLACAGDHFRRAVAARKAHSSPNA